VIRAAVLLLALTAACSREKPAPVPPAIGKELPTTTRAVGRKTESQKIEALIGKVAALEGGVFIRNGREHGPKEAAEHLRSKWRSAGDRIATASQFIDVAGSKSSMTGKPYQIRLSDGRTVPAADWLRERLAEIESEK
jgi:hypothetical protein